MLKKCLSAFILLPLAVFATDLKPWLDNFGELQFHGNYLLQTFHNVDVPGGPSRYNSYDKFYNFSIGGTVYNYKAEFESNFADTRHHSFGLDNLRLTGNYLFLNDVTAESPVSLMAGLTVTQALRISLNDIGSFHHGLIETEAHISVGKEMVCWQFWTSRAWAVFGIGVADVGSPWLRFDFAWEKNFWDLQRIKAYVNTLWGLGHHSLHLNRPFHGYGDIQHQSVDIGLSYFYRFYFGGEVSLDYSYRVHARNFPKNVNMYKLCFDYPFGLGI